jgi:methyl-accepting chemotaxis protein
MNIKSKMLIGAAILTAVPVLLSSLFIGYSAINAGQAALERDAQDSLIAIRDITASQVEQYFTDIERKATTASSNLMTVEAMSAFAQAFEEIQTEATNNAFFNHPEHRKNLKNYYENQFGSVYQKQNDNPAPITSQLKGLTPASMTLQNRYITSNPNPLGSKHLYDGPNQDTYDRLHHRYHRVFSQYIEQFGFYDLFLVDHKSGNIVYSVFKELDYATSLVNGPYADSGIAQAFEMANKLDDKNASALTDFSPYLPSYDSPASFIASPIYNGNNKVGILILQMPIDRLNSIMTYNQGWQETGLGESGETYLVGSDFNMRSNSRFLLEDKTNYLQLMGGLSLEQKVIDEIDLKNTSIGLQAVKTQGTKDALTGNKGFAIFEDYRNIKVLSAYRPINVKGLDWAIMSEIDASEAFAPITKLRKKTIVKATLAITLSIAFGLIGAWLMATTLTNPISNLKDRLFNMVEGEGDLTQRIAVNGIDEISKLSEAFNDFVSHLDTTFSQLIKSAMRLIPMSKELAAGNQALTESSNEQNRQLSKMRDRLYTASDSSEKVKGVSKLIAQSSSEGAQSVAIGLNSFQETEKEIQNLSGQMDSASQSIDSLKEENDRIVSVIDVISSIADQTNLLALNAAIEAARAGEAGRGFAVVADEVRALASRTRESTLEVSSMVEAIQSKTDTVVQTMSIGQETISTCNDYVNNAKEKLQDIEITMNQIAQNVGNINHTIEEQHNSFLAVSEDFNVMDECFHESQQASLVTMQIGKDMGKLSSRLMDFVNQFTLSDSEWDLSVRDRSKQNSSRQAKEEQQKELDEVFF